MGQLRRFGPEAPPALITLQSARRRDMTLRVECAPCGRFQVMRGRDLPDRRRAVCMGELWLAGRFRCAGCGRAATGLEVIESEAVGLRRERWRLGEPFAADGPRRHWRWDCWDRVGWAAWFRRR